MRNHSGGTRTERRKLFLTVASAAAIVVALLVGVIAASLGAQSAPGQAPTAQLPPQWQIDAGGKQAFDVASVEQDTADPSTARTNVPLGPTNVSTPSGGLLAAVNIPLVTYISFAYKLTGNQSQSLQSQLPKWATTERFDIQAKAEGNPTKDQMRLMMQALLADRFKLAVHNETRQLPVFGLVLVKPGKTGPQLQAHPDDAPCSTVQAPPSSAPAPPATVAGGFPALCGSPLYMPSSVPGRTRVAARNVTIGMLAGTMTGFGNLDRHVLDQTGLKGNFDWIIEWTPQFNGPVPPGAPQPDESGPTFLEALRDQLGLKLDSQTGPVDIMVIDHIEEPSPN
jgi:uncharacterized protein (TIGR03435 family)